VESIADSVDGAETVIFAIPGSAMDETVVALGDRLAGKLVIDAANRIGETLGDTAVMNILALLAESAPSATVYRAFNSLGWENFSEPELNGVRADLLFAGPEGETRSAVEGLITDVGLRPVYVGGPETAPLVDALGGLWGALAFGRGMGRRLFLKVITPETPQRRRGPPPPRAAGLHASAVVSQTGDLGLVGMSSNTMIVISGKKTARTTHSNGLRPLLAASMNVK
jgi:predicted dinucleotide-binding enzyme